MPSRFPSSSSPPPVARILYALNGQGRGHTSRSLAVADDLRQRGHEVVFCCGGEAAARLREAEPVVEVPAPREIVRGNRVRLWASAWHNAPLALRLPALVEDLAERVRELAPDVVVSDFEPFAPRAARRLGIPAVALARQHVLTETVVPVPPRHCASAALTRLGVHAIAPRALFDRMLVPTFSDFRHRAGRQAEVLPPILRADVRAAEPSSTGPVLVYVNHPAGNARLLRALGAADAEFVVYNLPQPAAAFANLTFRPASRAGFVRDLTACRALVCTAGFTLVSEALHLGKPVLALPNRGFFEQTLNALALEQTGRGEAVFGRLSARRVERFLRAARCRPPGGAVGNARAADAIEVVLRRRNQGREARRVPAGAAA